MIEDPRRVDHADVHLAGRVAATLTRGDGVIEFRYLPAYLADGGRPVATSLPLTDEPVVTVGGALPPFFSGLLPEGRRLSALRAAVKTSADDELSLLLAVGDDPVGDVRILAAGTDPAEIGPTVVADGDWTDLDFAELAGSAGIDPSALAGVQEKVSGRMLTLPLVHGGRFHLLKLDPPEYPHVVDNEAFFLRVARRLRQPVVETEVVHDRQGRAGLLVTRFDRVADGEGIRRLAVEDGAQLLRRYPADKYAVTTEHLVRRIGEVTPARAPAVRAVLQQVALAWLTGNGDLHAKNVSLVRDTEWRVAPVYDIPSTLPYGDHRLALTIAGRDDSLSRKRFLTLADEVGLTRRAAERALEEVLTVTADLDSELQEAFPMPPHVMRDVRRVLRRRREGLEG
ncbi:type II toxin-antitoxin system HipA family toxin [Mobilicoccus caccae]|uniref:Serine/threonine-protein kinase HipA n=1 Tax=Mobilicoccus caccae TaxID=1859295 RepID=A0ABQ6IVI6_9MICO|nr:HipA domain-containing protein [Mobilicoccus caccae]GMA40747.1 hypothetical protein GCM10025883_27920 [Mobilicoccus caccae]